jgi:hypothetical protein
VKQVANVIELYNGHNVTIAEKKTRVKRTESQMLESVSGDPLSEAHYLKARLIKLEEKMADLMSKASPKAIELVLQGNEHFGRYLP